MKKFELGKVYQQLNRNGEVCAEFTPKYLGEKQAFGIWIDDRYKNDDRELALPHDYLERTYGSSRFTYYREKPPEPRSLDIYINVYEYNGKLMTGGCTYDTEESAKNILNMGNSRYKAVGIAHVTFVEPKE